MGKRSTFNGYLRCRGASDARGGIQPSIGVLTAASKKIAVADASQADANVGFILPAGAIVTRISLISGVTGGVSPTVNLGLDFLGTETDDPDGLAANFSVSASGVVDVASGGALFATPLAEDANVTLGAGTGTAGTGGVDLIIEYSFDDDGVVNN